MQTNNTTTILWYYNNANEDFIKNLNVSFLGYSNQEVQRTCQRCELETIASKGIFNLRVKDVRLGEDEYFECQVSPGKGAINSVPLRTPVKITIQGNIIVINSRDSSVGRALDWRSKGPWFDPGSWQFILIISEQFTICIERK